MKLIVALRNLANAPKHVGVCVFVFHLLNYFADVDGNLYESCATGGDTSAPYVLIPYTLTLTWQTRERVRWDLHQRHFLWVSQIMYCSVSQTFFKWGPLSLVRMFYGPPYSWDYQTH